MIRNTRSHRSIRSAAVPAAATLLIPEVLVQSKHHCPARFLPPATAARRCGCWWHVNLTAADWHCLSLGYIGSPKWRVRLSV